MYTMMRTALPLALLLGLAGCGADVRELSRVSNSTGTVDAVVVEPKADGTAAALTELYLMPKGDKVSGDPIFRADQVAGLKLNWDGALSLKVHADHAQVLLKRERVNVYVLGPGSQFVHVGYDVGAQ